jgi:histidyl-tRNA synthetase
MKKQIPAIKGTKDILPREARTWQSVETVIKRVCELYGYREIRTPIFEATELFEKGTGETSDIVIKEMYTFKDKGGRSLTLRPEYTPSIVRSIIENRLYLKSDPLRFYFMGPMFRYDKPQKGRFRQFHQLDVEVFAEEDPAVDAELVEMADFLFKELKVSEIQTLVNSVGCKACRPSYIKKLRSQAEKEKQNLCDDCQRKVDSNPLRIFDCKVETCQAIAQDFPMITDFLCQECEEHFKQFCSYLDFYGLKYRVEPGLVRGIDYYTKTTFEIISPKLGAQDAILGGGRYDDMMTEFGGPDICGIGFAMGMERLLSVVPITKQKQQFLYLAYLGDEPKRAGMILAQFLRKEGMECLLEYREKNLKNQLSRANKLGATWALIIGDDEVKKRKYQLKNMVTGKQTECSREEILNIIRENT